jgi:hypothetical protein
MKYQETSECEETSKMANMTSQSQTLSQSPINQDQSMQSDSSTDKQKWIYINPSIYLMYCLLNGFSILLGCFFKLVYPISRESIGKKSILTGIPIIRNNYFVGPFLLNLTYFIWSIYIFYKNPYIKAKYRNSVLNYLKHIRGAFFFTNIFLLMIFYALYYYITIPIFKSYGFKLSGHTIASILSGGMIVNLHNTYEPFSKLNLDNKFNNYISMINMFLYYHSIYTIFWSSWIFHTIQELVYAYIISISSLVMIHSVNIDELMLNLFDFSNPRKNPVIIYKHSG